MGLAMFGITIPTFVMAPILTLIFGVYGITLFGIDLSLPVGGWNGGALRNMILPVIVLALPQIAIIARLTRGSMIEVLRSNYIRTARAKGCQPSHRLRHALRAAMLPLVSYLGPASPASSPARWSWSRSSACPASAATSCRRAQPRLHAGDGRGDLLRDLDHPAEPAGRHALRVLDPRVRYRT
jgi:hypothetical protein